MSLRDDILGLLSAEWMSYKAIDAALPGHTEATLQRVLRTLEAEGKAERMHPRGDGKKRDGRIDYQRQPRVYWRAKA
jgi:DNA-binding HxlR family transcriptional regulator